MGRSKTWLVPHFYGVNKRENKVNKHGNLFVVIVGLAAWLHSSWAFATVIGGSTPVTVIGSVSDLFHWLYWYGPGAAAAAAVDVGMINLAAQFKRGQGTRARLTTFAALSVISYVGQVLFSVSHSGAYTPSVGLSEFSASIAAVVWQLFIWLLPATLPVTLILWAWSDVQAPTVQKSEPETQVIIENPVETAVTVVEEPKEVKKQNFLAACPKCGWQRLYDDPGTAARALQTHTRTCTGVKVEILEDADV